MNYGNHKETDDTGPPANCPREEPAIKRAEDGAETIDEENLKNELA